MVPRPRCAELIRPEEQQCPWERGAPVLRSALSSRAPPGAEHSHLSLRLDPSPRTQLPCEEGAQRRRCLASQGGSLFSTIGVFSPFPADRRVPFGLRQCFAEGVKLPASWERPWPSGSTFSWHRPSLSLAAPR